MAEKLYLIDSYAHIFRSYYAIRNLTNNAVFGFTRTLMMLIQQFQPRYMVAVFDSKGPTFRHEMYPQYKANRKKMPDDLREQIPLVHEVVDAFGLPKTELSGFEADDLIATLAHEGRKAGFEVYIVSSDKDLFQLVGNGVYMLDPRKEYLIMDEKAVAETFGVPPEKVAEVLALMGDSSDNVPGAKGIGPKTAIQLIKAFGSIEGIYSNLDQLKGKKRENLEQSRELVKLSRELVTLRPAPEPPIPLNACRFTPPEPEQLIPVFKKLNFHALLKEIGGAEPRENIKTDYRVLNTPDEVDELARELARKPFFAFDFETCSLDTIAPEIAGISFSAEAGKAVYIPFVSRGQTLLDCKKTLRKLKSVLENPKIGKIGHNIKYEYEVLHAKGIHLTGIRDDSMVQSYLLNAGMRHHSLDETAARVLNRRTTTFKELTGGLSFCELPVEKVVDYACEDSDIALQLAEYFRPRIEAEGLMPLYEEIERPLIPVLGEMEQAGVLVDRDFLRQLSAEFSGKLRILEQQIYKAAGVEFNINSPKQMGFILFEKMGLPILKKTRKTKSYSTSHEVLEELAASHDIARLIVEYRMFSKLKSTYVDALPEMIHPKTGRIHTSYNQTVAATGRLSSSDPNLQNIPIRSKEGIRIREAFIAPPGMQLLSADYSQVELRVLAHLSKDETLIQAFRDGEDIHTRTASELFNVPLEAVTSELRSRAKAINFGVVYGKREFSMAKELGISVKEARDFITHYFERMPRVKQFIDEIIETTKKTGEISTLFGRKRKIPEINSKNGNLRQSGERMAVNTPIQGTAADIIKKAMITIHNRLETSALNARMIMQVHDELIFEVADADIEPLSRLVTEEMEQIVDMAVPLKVNIGIGPNWANTK
ncbi:MAG: DNA polymerase I [Acidobacteria bacterium]|nr:DNA polymerase I [Acidobacteriota bacterium]